MVYIQEDDVQSMTDFQAMICCFLFLHREWTRCVIISNVRANLQSFGNHKAMNNHSDLNKCIKVQATQSRVRQRKDRIAKVCCNHGADLENAGMEPLNQHKKKRKISAYFSP